MAIVSYCSLDQWAIKKDYATFVLYAAANESPKEAGLTEMLDEMTELMNSEVGSVSVNLTTHLTVLRNICYRGVELMRDEEQARATEIARDVGIPRDYMFERDREKLRRFGVEEGFRVVGGVGS